MRKPKVLVADDDPQMRGLLLRVMEETGFDVAEVANGSDALNAMASTDFDLLVLDLFMPHLGGLDVLQALLRRGSRTPVIAMTGGADRSVEEPLKRALALGAATVFAKPFDVAEFAETAVRLARPGSP
jgi:CheY-like chemotaxis protein